MFKGFNNACDWSFSFPCHHLLILSRCFMAILRIWRADRGKTLPISFVWDSEFLTQMVDSLSPGQRQGILPSTSKRRNGGRKTLSSLITLPVICLWFAKLRQHGFPGGKTRKEESQQATWKYLLVWVITEHFSIIRNVDEEDKSWRKVLLSDLSPKLSVIFLLVYQSYQFS